MKSVPSNWNVELLRTKKVFDLECSAGSLQESQLILIAKFDLQKAREGKCIEDCVVFNGILTKESSDGTSMVKQGNIVIIDGKTTHFSLSERVREGVELFCAQTLEQAKLIAKEHINGS